MNHSFRVWGGGEESFCLHALAAKPTPARFVAKHSQRIPCWIKFLCNINPTDKNLYSCLHWHACREEFQGAREATASQPPSQIVSYGAKPVSKPLKDRSCWKSVHIQLGMRLCGHVEWVSFMTSSCSKEASFCWCAGLQNPKCHRLAFIHEPSVLSVNRNLWLQFGIKECRLSRWARPRSQKPYAVGKTK